MSEPQTIKINEVEYVRKDSIPITPQGEKAPWHIGKNYFIRTVTNYFTGRLDWVGENEIVLSCAAWVADTGRFSDALKTGVLTEVEPYPTATTVIVSRGALVDASLWLFDLPMVKK